MILGRKWKKDGGLLPTSLFSEAFIMLSARQERAETNVVLTLLKKRLTSPWTSESELVRGNPSDFQTLRAVKPVHVVLRLNFSPFPSQHSQVATWVAKLWQIAQFDVSKPKMLPNGTLSPTFSRVCASEWFHTFVLDGLFKRLKLIALNKIQCKFDSCLIHGIRQILGLSSPSLVILKGIKR